MKSYKFSVVRNASDTRVERMTGYEIRQLTNRIDRYMVDAIRAGESGLKRNLPAVCWGAEFKDGRRRAAEGNIKDNGMRFIDIDHITQEKDPQKRRQDVITFYEKHIVPVIVHRADIIVCHVQISPSGDGLHVVWLDESRNLEEAQAFFARSAELPCYDDRCKDQGRMFFLSPLEDTLFDTTDLFFD